MTDDRAQDPYGQNPPPPPPGQPGGQQQPGAPQPGGGQPQGGGLDPKIAGLLAYLLGVIGGLIIFLTQQNPELRFHGMQSILYAVGWGVIWVAWAIVSAILSAIVSFLGLIMWILGLLVGIALLVGWIFLIIKGYNVEHFKMPLIGDLAEQWSGYSPAAA